MMTADNIAYVRYLRDKAKLYERYAWECDSSSRHEQHLGDALLYGQMARAWCESHGGHRYRHDGALRARNYKHCRYCGHQESRA